MCVCVHSSPFLPQVVQTPLSEPSMSSWVPLFTPEPGTTIKDMDVVGNHCVLVARVPAGDLVLTTVLLTNPEEVRTLRVGAARCSSSCRSLTLQLMYQIFPSCPPGPAPSE